MGSIVISYTCLFDNLPVCVSNCEHQDKIDARRWDKKAYNNHGLIYAKKEDGMCKLSSRWILEFLINGGVSSFLYLYHTQKKSIQICFALMQGENLFLNHHFNLCTCDNFLWIYKLWVLTDTAAKKRQQTCEINLITKLT